MNGYSIMLCFLGSGILTGADGSVYEGGFHNNMRHGEGIQMYRYGNSNLTCLSKFNLNLYMYHTCIPGQIGQTLNFVN